MRNWQRHLAFAFLLFIFFLAACAVMEWTWVIDKVGAVIYGPRVDLSIPGIITLVYAGYWLRGKWDERQQRQESDVRLNRSTQHGGTGRPD